MEYRINVLWELVYTPSNAPLNICKGMRFYAFLIYAFYPRYANFLRYTILRFLPVGHFTLYVIHFLPTPTVKTNKGYGTDILKLGI